ncbi:DUF6029 family protein [Bacteroidales bacterium OttesenSCG-928-I21]|nr:DUF6029 family protein [Bacteroidales bacterium OttesenSCG-928-I21]
MKKKHFFLILCFCNIGFFSLHAQVEEKERNFGHISGNFQADGQYYFEDSKIGATAVDEKFLINSYANFTYTLGNFSAGFRYEGYMNSLLGYPNTGGLNDGIGIPYRWANFNNGNIEVTVGNFYEQFGNGLVLRAYEEKMLGVDNVLDGLRVKFNPYKGIYLKGLVGKQRYYWTKSDGIVRGFDGEIQFNDLINSFSESRLRVSVGGSFVSKYQKEENPIYNLPNNVGAAAGRLNINYNGFNLETEYAYKINDPSADNSYIYKPGQAFLVNASYSKKGLGIILSTKWVDNMSFRSDRNAGLTDLSINLLPEISKNHTYSLAAFYPYASQTNGEWGIKTEVMYRFARNTALGGKYGTTVSVNFSRVHDIGRNPLNDTTPLWASGTDGYKTSFFSIGKELYFQDINVEISKKWTPKFYTILSYVNIFYNFDVLRGKVNHENVKAHIGIFDMTYKLTNQIALRGEFQAMFTKQDEGNWASVLLEFTIPNWFFTIINNMNYNNPESDKLTNYFTAGFGFVKGGNRIQLSYGKQRAGVMCVGGVCRTVPASNGIMLSISSTF